MDDRLLKWFVFTILFAFIPVGISIFCNFFSLKPLKEGTEFIGELLFFTIMISSTSLRDIIDLNRIVRDAILTCIVTALILLLIFCSAFYVLFLQSESSTINMNGLFKTSITLAIIGGILGTLVQIYIGRVEVRQL